jgi:hypothetical protein
LAIETPFNFVGPLSAEIRFLLSFPFRTHNGTPKINPVKDYFFNRVQYSTKALWLVNCATKFLSSGVRIGFTKPFPNDNTILINHSRYDVKSNQFSVQRRSSLRDTVASLAVKMPRMWPPSWCQKPPHFNTVSEETRPAILVTTSHDTGLAGLKPTGLTDFPCAAGRHDLLRRRSGTATSTARGLLI